MIKRLVKYFAVLILIAALGFASLLTYSTLTDFTPEQIIETEITNKQTLKTVPDTLSVLIWNIGYMGLGAEMDFFNDGGKNVRANESTSKKYRENIIRFLEENKAFTDFILLQEVDINSKRSYFINQTELIGQKLPEFCSSVAINYDVKFVPVPFSFPYTPYGKTLGGLQNLSKINPINTERVQYPGGFSWPTKLYMLDRCALEWRFPLSNGKELLIVNTHNTAYDQTGEIKKVEMAFMKERYDKETEKGNLVIIGGDWNQTPPGVNSTRFSTNIQPGYTAQSLTTDMLPDGFRIAADTSKATNRSNGTPYSPSNSYTTLIDYFMYSPGVECIEVNTIDLRFQNSDHQPVLARFVLKK